MAETQNSPTDTEGNDGGQCPARSAVPNSKDMQFSSSSEGVVNLQQGDGAENQEQGCFGPPKKRKKAALKFSTQNMRKKLRRRSGNEENDVSGIHTDRPVQSQEPVQNVDSLEQPSIAVTRGEGDAVTDNGQLYATESLPRISETRVGAPSTDIREAHSCNSLVLDYSNLPRTDMDRKFPGFLASESQNSPYNATPRNRMKSLPAMFPNSQILLDPPGGYCCAQNIDDMKLFQILRYIKSCDGGLDLLSNFLHEHAELLPLQYVNVTQDTVDQENHEGEETHNLDMELCSNQDKEVEFMMGENNVGGEIKKEVSDLHGIESESTVDRSDVEDNQDKEVESMMGENNMEGEIKKEVSDLHDIESESTVDRSDVEDNQDKEVESMMGENNVEGEIKKEVSDLHDIESESTVDRSDVEDNQDKEVESMMGENNMESEIKNEVSDLHDIESESTVDRSDVEDNQDKEVESMMGENNMEGEIKKEVSDLHDIESESTVDRSDVEDNQDKEVESMMGENNMEGEIKNEVSDLHDIESESTVDRSDVEDNQDKEVESMMGENNVEGEIKKEVSDLHDIESESTVDRSDVEDNQDKEVESMMGENNMEGEIKNEVSDLHDIESESTVDRSDVEDNQDKEVESMMGENNVEGEIKKEVSDLHDIESESTVDRSDVEDNQDKEVESMMGENNVEGEIKKEVSDLHDIESESTVDRSDVEDNQDKEVESMMGENNVEGEIKNEVSDLHVTESESTVDRSDVEDNQDKEVESMMGENNVEGEIKEVSDLHDIESESTVDRSDVEDNQDKEVESTIGENNVEGEIEEFSDLHDIESESTVDRSDIEDNQDKEAEESKGGNNVESEIKEEISDLHDFELHFTAEHSDVEDNPYKESGDSLNDSNLEAAEIKGKIDCHDVESVLTLAHNNIEATDAYSSCDSSDNMSGNRSEEKYPRKSDYFSSGHIPEVISIFVASSVSISENNDVDGECPLFCESTTVRPIAVSADSSVSCKECSTHCNGFDCCTNGYTCGDGQYHHRKEDNLAEDGTGKPVCCVVGHSEDERNGLTGSNVEAENISELYAETEGSQVEKGDKNPVGQTSSDIMAGYPMSPKADFNNDGEIYLVPGRVQGDAISYLKDHENILDTARLNIKENETHCGEHEGVQREATGKQGCPVWQILEHLECPFNWVPDICIKRTLGGTIPEDMIYHLTGKEKEFSQVKSSIFREVTIYLVLAYEKTLEDNLMDAITDLHHCYTLLDNPEILTWCAETKSEELDLTLVRGKYHFSEMKRTRRCLLYDMDEKATEKHLPVKDGDDESEVINRAKLPRHTAREKSGSCDAELMGSNIKAVDQAIEAKKIADSEEYCEGGGAAGLSAECMLTVTNIEVKNQEEESYVKEMKKCTDVTDFQSVPSVHEDGIRGSRYEDEFQKASVNGQNKWVVLQCEKVDGEVRGKRVDTQKGESGNVYIKNGSHKLETLLVNERSEKRNQDALYNHNLLADIMQKTECDKTTKDSENEKPVREDNEPMKQAQRIAAIKYVVNATLAYVAYFSESSQEAYKLAKYIKHTYEQLGSAGKATVAALRGAMLLEYGYTGNKLGLQFLQKALELDPDYWEWNLYCGKVMGRVRRVEKFRGEEPGKEELRLLEKAVQLNHVDASALVQLANTYRALSYCKYKESLEVRAKAESVIETRHYVRYGGVARWKENWSRSRRSQQQEELGPLKRVYSSQHTALSHADTPLDIEQKEYLQSAKKLYLKALEMEPHCPYINARCAKALWAMPVPYKDKERAKEAIFCALTLAPNDSFVNHYAAMFFEYYRDYEKALAYYKLAIRNPNLNYPAEMNYINLKMKISPPGSYSPVFHLSALLSKYRSHNYVVQTLCHRGFYLYKMEKRHLHAIQDISTAIKTDADCQTLKTFYPGSFYGRDNIQNMYDLLEEMAAEYRQLPEGQADKDFVEVTVQAIRHLKK